jgi:hypothetical protein
MRKSKKILPLLIAALIFGCGANIVLAQDSASVLYVPLIGVTLVPEPLALPNGPGDVTYRYAVKNFLEGMPLTDIRVVDDKCNSVKFVTGDDNGDTKLGYGETWRYVCTSTLFTTRESIAVATGHANDITATHKAYATVVVGSDNPPPLVSIVNVTKVAYPLSLPIEGGGITYTYKVTNPGIVPLGNVIVRDDKCSAMSGKLGDTNGNDLLDVHEVWIYTCTIDLKETTTNTVTVTAFANGLKAVDSATLTVKVDDSVVRPVPGFPSQPIPSFPETGVGPGLKLIVWVILSVGLVMLVLLLFFMKYVRSGKRQKEQKPLETNKKQ